MDHHEALCCAVDHVALFRMRSVADLELTAAAHSLRAQILPGAGGWGDHRSFGQTRPKGLEIRADADAPSVLITWREIAAAILAAWRPWMTDLVDAASYARRQLQSVAPIDWPPGVDAHHDLYRRVSAAERELTDEVLLNVAACDPAFDPEPLVLL